MTSGQILFRNLCNHYSAREHVGSQIAIAKYFGYTRWTKAGAIWGRSTPTGAQALVKQGIRDIFQYISTKDIQDIHIDAPDIAYVAERFWRKYHREYSLV